jgi:hypothetical protein
MKDKIIATFLSSGLWIFFFLELLVYFQILPKGPICSDKDIAVFSIKTAPKNFRLIVFSIMHIIAFIAISLAQIDTDRCRNFMFLYTLFLLLIEPTIIHLNKDTEAKKKLDAYYKPSLSARTKALILLTIIAIGFIYLW